MQASTQREIPDPPNFARAYSYCSKTGFYRGLIQKQPDPRSPGAFLMPAFCVSEKPKFVEGYMPRWNGEAWELVPRDQAEPKRETVERVIEDARRVIFEDAERHLAALIEREFEKQAVRFERALNARLEAILRAHKTGVDESVASLLEVNGDQVVRTLNGRMEAVMNDLVKIEQRAHDVHAQTLQAAQQIQEQVAQDAADVAETKSWWQKIIGK